MSNYVVDAVATDVRILGRIMEETWGGIKRTNWMNIVIVVTMASILTIFGTLFAFVLETQIFVENIGSGLKISVFAKDNTDIIELQRKLQGISNVKSVDLIPKEKAWNDMKTNYQVPEINNPLPDTFHVQLSSQKYLESSYEAIKKMPEVEQAYFAKSVLKKLQKISQVTSFVGMGVSFFFGVLTLFIISNTIHLLIEARSQEIEILRMMGVGNWYIQLPFLFQGAAYGLFGAIIAYIPLSVAQHYINELFLYFQFSTNDYSLGIVFLTLVLMGLFVGAGGAWLSVHKYLRI